MCLMATINQHCFGGSIPPRSALPDFIAFCGRYVFAAVSELLCLLFPEPLGNRVCLATKTHLQHSKRIIIHLIGGYSTNDWTVWTLTSMVYPLAIPQNTISSKEQGELEAKEEHRASSGHVGREQIGA